MDVKAAKSWEDIYHGRAFGCYNAGNYLDGTVWHIAAHMCRAASWSATSGMDAAEQKVIRTYQGV